MHAVVAGEADEEGAERQLHFGDADREFIADGRHGREVHVDRDGAEGGQQAEHGDRLRIEQLARDKARLDNERRLEMKLRLLATRMLDEQGKEKLGAEPAPPDQTA